MGWEALDQWGDDVARIERFQTGGVNEVWSVRVNGQLAVARLGKRGGADLSWETELLRYRDPNSTVQSHRPHPSTAGRRSDGLVRAYPAAWNHGS